jgi:hypothetical protein
MTNEKAREREDAIAGVILRLTETHLRARERDGGVVSTVALGSSFEGWLAVEVRLAVEQGLGELAQVIGASREDIWTATEWPQKVDLSIGTTNEPQVTVELKVVHNNKKCEAQCDAVWRDLLQRRPVKQRMARPMAMVATVWKHYEPPMPWYPGQDVNGGADEWRRRTREYLRCADGWLGHRGRLLGSPIAFPLTPRSVYGLRPGAEHSLAIEMMTLEPCS